MKLDKISSERLSLLRFPLIVGVIFLHSYSSDVALSTVRAGLIQTSCYSSFIREFVSQGLARVAVPLFFLMSGYFFFIKFEWSLDNYKRQLQSRVNSLLIPFVFWNVSVLLFLAIAQSLPATQIYFSGANAPIGTFGAYDYLDAIFGIDRFPISYQFWFIRDLMVMVLFVPIIQIILKKVPTIFLVVLFALWFIDIWPVYIPSSRAFLFFYIGSFFAFNKKNLFEFDKYGIPIIGVYLVVLLIGVASKESSFSIYIYNSGIVFGILSALYCTKLVLTHKYLKEKLLWAAKYSFFVFAIHEPFLMVCRKVTYKILMPSTDLMILFLYVTIPVFIVIISILTYETLQYSAPKFLKYITGGRDTSTG